MQVRFLPGASGRGGPCYRPRFSVAESTLEAPTISEAAAAEQAFPREPEPWTLRAYVSEHPGVSTAVVILVISVVLVVWARTRPSYDAYGWMVWGYQTLHLSLDLGGAPSWKPVPFLFTVPFALFGHYQLWLWMITACAVALAGPVFGARIAFRLCEGSGPRGGSGALERFAPYVAAFVAGAAVLGIEDYLHYILSSQSDPMLVTFTLAALDMGLLGRYRWALLFGVLTGLGRPEVWPFLGLFMLWCWFKVPSMRWMLVAGVVAIGFMWFGIPTITNGRPDVAGQLAKGSPRELKSNQLSGTISRFHEMQYLPVWIAAGFAVALAAMRRNLVVLALGVGIVAWLIVEIAFAYHGWPALPRYMFEAAGVVAVLAGVAVGWLLRDMPRIVRGVPASAGALIAGVLVVAMIPGALHRVRLEHQDLRHERARTHQITLLAGVTNALGGARHVLNCGQPVTDVGYVSSLAWLYHLDVGAVGGFQQHVEGAELANPAIPKVLFKPGSRGGWDVRPWHTRPSQVARCAGLNAIYTNSRALIRR
jgi:hypothetical protein